MTFQRIRKFFLLFPRSSFLSLFLSGVLLVLPLFVDPYVLHTLILCLFYSILALNWNLLYGYAGQLNFAYGALFGIGAYTSALLAMKVEVSPWIGLLLAGLMSVLISAPIALCCLRLGISYMAIMTIALGEICRLICARWTTLTRGYIGLWGIPPFPDLKLFGVTISFKGTNKLPYYYVSLAILFVAIYINYKLLRSKIGLSLCAIRDDEEAAASLGINPVKYKFLAFSITSFFAGLTGGLYAHYIQILTPSLMDISTTLWVLSMVLFGGVGSLMGPLIGAFTFILSSELLRFIGEWRYVIFSSALIGIVLFFPEGIIGIFRKILRARGD